MPIKCQNRMEPYSFDIRYTIRNCTVKRVNFIHEKRFTNRPEITIY
jgi:hypothetical protein